MRMAISSFLMVLAAVTLGRAAASAANHREEDAKSGNLRRGLQSCVSDQICTEKWEGRYQRYSDGYCQEFNRCGSYYERNCICVDEVQRSKNYIIESNGDFNSHRAYYPNSLPYGRIGPFTEDPYVSTHEIRMHDGGIVLANYEWRLGVESTEGIITLPNDVPITSNGATIFSHSMFGFRVLQSGTFRFSAHFESDVFERNSFTIDIWNRSTNHQDVFSVVFNPRRVVDESEVVVELETGNNYVLEIFSWISGSAGQTRMEWKMAYKG